MAETQHVAAVTMTYHGDCTHMATEKQWVGPNLLGEVMEAVTAEYDRGARTTRVGFRYVSKDEVSRRIQEIRNSA